MTGYDGYEDWKRWDERFSPSEYDESYFAGETQGIKVRDADLLEIGFGAGHFLAWARAAGARIHGSETLDSLRKEAQAQSIDLLPPDIEAVAEEYCARFDTVVAFDVFEHWSLDEIETRLLALEKMVRPGGSVLLRFPNAQSPFGLAAQHGDPTHKTFLSKGVFEQLIQGIDFSIVRYGPSFRVETGAPKEKLVRIFRHRCRSLISFLLGAIYATDIPWDPVVVIVLRRGES